MARTMSAEYMRQYRATHPEYVEANRQGNKARYRAHRDGLPVPPKKHRKYEGFVVLHLPTGGMNGVWRKKSDAINSIEHIYNPQFYGPFLVVSIVYSSVYDVLRPDDYWLPDMQRRGLLEPFRKEVQGEITDWKVTNG